jgi:hypothetical protein
MHAARCCAVPSADAGTVIQIAVRTKTLPITAVACLFILIFCSCSVAGTALSRMNREEQYRPLKHKYRLVMRLSLPLIATLKLPTNSEAARAISISNTRISKSYLYG